jgi:hypothetical protein
MDRHTAILVETAPSMDLGAPSKRLQATREALRLLGGAGAWTVCEGAVRWVPARAIAATLGAARHVDLPRAARQIARLPVRRVVVIGDLYDPRAVLDAMGMLRDRDRVFVEVLTPAERGAAPTCAVERALVAYLETLRPHRERALGRLRASGVRLEDLLLAA